jgi:hypothetical protein
MLDNRPSSLLKGRRSPHRDRNCAPLIVSVLVIIAATASVTTVLVTRLLAPATPSPVVSPEELGLLCTLDSAAFINKVVSPTCAEAGNTSECVALWLDPTADPVCIIDTCTLGAFPEGVNYVVTTGLQDDDLYMIQFRLYAPFGNLTAELVSRLIAENNETIGSLSANAVWDQTWLTNPVGVFSTSGGLLLREIMTMNWNVQMVQAYSNETVTAYLDSLVFAGGGCGGLPSWVNTSVGVMSLWNFARYAVGVNYLYLESGPGIELLMTVCAGKVWDDVLCDLYESVYTFPDLVNTDPDSEGESLFEALHAALALANADFVGCPANGRSSCIMALPTPAPSAA